MKRKDREAKRALTSAELQSELSLINEKLFKLRFQKLFGAPKNPLEVRSLRRDRARLLTWICSKEDS